jgi:hypothetical protein
MRKAMKVIIYMNFDPEYVAADFEDSLKEKLTAELESDPSVEAAQIDFEYEEE